MNAKFELMKLRQLDEKIKPLRALLETTRPPRGWIRAIRQGLGMTSHDLAQRLNISQPGVLSLEKSEAAHKITLETLARAAQALDGVLVYAVIPRQKLEKSVRNQARRLARQLLQRTSGTMELEAQGLTQKKNKAQEKELVEELLARRPRPFWK